MSPAINRRKSSSSAVIPKIPSRIAVQTSNPVCSSAVPLLAIRACHRKNLMAGLLIDIGPCAL